VANKTEKFFLIPVVVFIILIICRFIAHLILPIYDDAFITFRFAKNFAEGNGLIYNMGERVLGLTCPLYGLVCSLFFLLSIPIEKAIVGFNILVEIFILLFASHVFLKKYRTTSLIILGTLLAVSPILNRISVGGMETDFYILFSIIAIGLYINNHKYYSISVASISYFIRPEALLLVAVLLIFELYYNGFGNFLKSSVISFFILALPSLYIYYYYGTLVSQSVLAKAGLEYHSSFYDVAKTFFFPDPLSVFFIPLSAWGVIKFYKKELFVKILTVWIFSYIIIYSIIRPSMWSWYGGPVLFFIILMACLGFIDLLYRLPKIKQILPIVLVIPVIFWIALYNIKGPSKVRSCIYKPLKKWSQKKIEKSDTIIAGDIGAIGFYSNAYIYDTAGLVWPEALQFKTAAEIIQKYKPDYLFFNMNSNSIRKMKKSSYLIEYQFLKSFTLEPKIFSLNPEEYSSSWIQEYFLMKQKLIENQSQNQ
jgi:hypothetical protein